MTDRNDAGRFSARQKMFLYVTTLVVLAVLYLAPDFLKFVAALPEYGWKAIFLSVAIFVGGSMLVLAFAIWQVFHTGKLAIKRALGTFRGTKNVVE